MNMYSQQREVADLFQQLKDKSYSREQRANASKALKAIVSGCMTVEQFTPEWQMVYDDVAQILCGKIGMENKRALGEVAAYLLAMLPYDLVWILDWIKGNYEKTPPKYEEERSILVGILTTGLELLVQGGMPELVQDNLIMESLDFVINSLNAIDKLTYDELLETLFNSLVMFSGCYPVQFRQKFETTIRTVLAWSVEPISAKLQRRCCELCRFFLPYWDSGLAEKLTEEYLETFEANLDKLSGRQDKELLSKNRAMIFSVSAIIETFVEMEEQQWAVGKVTEVLDLAKNIENILLSTGASKEKALFLSSFCQVYEKIIPLWKTDFAQRVSERTVHQSLAFARQSLSSPNAMSEYLTFFSKFYGNPTIPVALTSEISKAVLGDGGLLDGIITPTTKRSMFSAVKNILSAMLTPISIVQLQESFSLIKQNMLGSISILLDSLDNETIDTQQVNIAKIKATLFAKAMEPFASITSSLIVIMGMQPSLLQVLCLEFPVYEPSFGSHFPAVQYALLKLIVTNCESHEYFLATSDWLTASKNSQITESRTSKHAQIQLETICKCLKAGIRWKPTRELVCSWLAALLARIDDSLLVQLAKRREWVELHRAVITGLLEEDVEESLHEVARRLGVMSNEHEKNIAHIVSTVHEKIANINPERSRSVRGSIDSSLFIRCSVSNKGWDLLESRQQRATVSSFSTNHFSLLADFILKGIAPSLSLNPEDDMLWIFDTINIIYGSQNEKTAPKDVNRYIQKWRWALTQMALHCVENKMKTSLGKATDTFTAIGAEIQRLGKIALGMMEDRRSNEKKKQIETVKSPKKIAKEDEDDEEYGLERELTEAEEWWRVRCLLEFVEIFDKMMFNAITGAHFPLATVSQQARQFFHANLASCNEWLSRTYPVAMIVAFHAGYYAQVIRFGSAALIDMEKRQLKTEQVAKEKEISVPAPSPNSLAVIMLMGRAMSELGAAQAAKGLQNWTVKVFKFEARWLTGAVEMASARYESALRHLIDSLHNDELPDTLKIHLRAMIFDVLNKLRLPMLLEPSKCPTDMCIWTEADDLESVPAGFDADAMTKLTQLCSFSKAEHVSGNSKRWDVNDLLFSTEAQLMQTLRRTEVLDMKDKLSELGYLVFLTDSGQRAHGRIATLEKIFAALAAKMNKKFHENDNAAMELDPTFLSHSREDIGERLSHARKLCFWAERLEVSPATFEQPAIMARKTGNYHLAGELLQKIDLMSPSSSATKRFLVCTLEQSKMLWDNEDKSIRGGAWSQTFLALDKALMVENIRQQQLLFIANGGMPAVNGTHRIENCCEQISKAALKLADWISQDDELTAVLQPEIFQSPLWNQMESGVRSFGGDYSKFLVSLAAQVTPSMAKAHLRLGEWFYSAAENAYTTVGKENFINRYRAFMASVSEEAFDKLWELLFKATSLADLNESVGKLVDSSTATFFLGNGSKYIETWSQHQQHKISLLTGAINSYFAYIAQLGVKEQHTMGSVSATLRILGLLANNSDVLASIVTLGFSQTNDSLWKDILPQLFARLSHPNALVRDAIVTLLSKICISAPHSVVFQVVSGASSFVEESDDVIEAEDAEEQEIAKKEKTLMFECCQQLKVTLNEINPSLVADVQVFVNELQKISLLNEEKWTFVLSNLDHEMSKRLEQIRKETERTNSSPHLTAHEKTEIIAEKSQLITSSVYCILVDLYDRTCVQKPSTLNEELFVEEFGSELKKAFEQSKNSSKNPEKTWAPFRQFLSVLQQKNARRGAQILRIQDISTVLADLSGTSIPLPGQENNDYSEVVTLSRVGGSTQILPTKTRPKKMSFIGSDGKEQTFLFKGQEDLHLDERIMQALQICNLMLARSSKRSWPEYRARHYAVTPLGPRSGLIQWVGGATPLFFIYRKWQQRQAQILHSLEKKNGAASAVPEVERPTDMYQKQLRSAFLKHKVEPEIIADRSKWPLNIQKEVFHNLQKETPKDLVSRELWMKAGSSDSWWRVCSRLARSTAVMSIVGAILGLGDRHLDNLLINLDKGEVVHIDYNICFDKGKTLRVPETVPFRLTQNIAHAMGPTQTEGVFRESCCHVLENLRTNREVLLTILEAFVYDPLVDWTTTDHLTSTSAAVSVAVTLAVYGNDSRIHDAKPIARKMFSVRRKEYAVPWLRNYSDLTGILENLKEILLKMINGGSAWDSPSSLEQRKVDGKRKLQVALSDEQNMMKQFRSLMKTLATCDERFAVYLKTYKEHFHQPVLKVFHLLDSQDPEDRNLCLEKLDIVQEKIHSIYHDIFTIDSKELTPKTVQEKPDPSRTPPPGLEDRLVRNEQQEQNVYAQNAVRKVRARLEGRVEDARTLSVEEQVDYFIRHATSSSRLAQMYEGWTSWV